MNITVVGTGYVGLVVGACLAETGNDVICADVDERKIGMLLRSEIPIYEPGLEALVERNQKQGRLSMRFFCFRTANVPGGAQGLTPMPISFAIGINSRSTVRSIRL